MGTGGDVTTRGSADGRPPFADGQWRIDGHPWDASSKDVHPRMGLGFEFSIFVLKRGFEFSIFVLKRGFEFSIFVII